MGDIFVPLDLEVEPSLLSPCLALSHIHVLTELFALSRRKVILSVSQAEAMVLGHFVRGAPAFQCAVKILQVISAKRDLSTDRKDRPIRGCLGWHRGRSDRARRSPLVPVPWPDEQRRVVVLTRDSAIGYLSAVTVAPIISKVRGVPSEVLLTERDGTKARCAINLHNVVTVSKAHLGRRVAILSRSV